MTFCAVLEPDVIRLATVYTTIHFTRTSRLVIYIVMKLLNTAFLKRFAKERLRSDCDGNNIYVSIFNLDVLRYHLGPEEC